MTYKDWLEIVAAWSAILTAVVAVIAYGGFIIGGIRKRWRLEKYLKAQLALGKDRGQRTLVHLVANLGMSETEIMDSAFRSNHVERKVEVQGGKAVNILLSYK